MAEDVLYFILKELQHENNSLYSCLLVNKTWCKIIIPILWKNPWEYLTDVENLRFSAIIISHLSNEAKDTWKSWGIDLPSMQQKPLFNYISFCRYLDLYKLEIMCFRVWSKFHVARDELLNLFINSNTRFTHLYVPKLLDYQLHLMPGAEHCFSELKSLHCYNFGSYGITSPYANQSAVEELTRITKSIKKLVILSNYNCSGVVKLIETQKNLNDVCFPSYEDESYCRTLEESLIKHANTIQYLQIGWIPTKVLSYLVNLISLKVERVYLTYNRGWNRLENASLPVLKILKTKSVSSISLAILIESTKGHLTEISIDGYDSYDGHNGHIQAIYKNCPNLKYLKLTLTNREILELEQLLINCQHLNGLIIDAPDLDRLFKVLVQSSPTSLYKFKFILYNIPKLETVKLFLDDWKGRHPMILQIIPMVGNGKTDIFFYLMKEYKAKGIVKKYDMDLYGRNFEDFEWIQKNPQT